MHDCGMTTNGPDEKATGPQSAGNRVCAIVVTYHPGPEVPAHIEAILGQVSRVVVVDNEATAESRERLSAFGNHPSVELIENLENLGIATALNQGTARALAGGFDWIATFDQDSGVPEGYFAELLAAHASYPERDRIAVLAPLYRDRHLGFVYSPAGSVRHNLTGNVPVSVTAASGNLVSPAALRTVGGFRDDFFIAYVDFEFCLRCRRAGWLVLEVRRVILDHAMGEYQQRRWLGRNVRINDYSIARRYYQARNLLILYACLGSVDLRWALRDAWFYSHDVIKVLLFGENRWEKVCAMATGYWHAVTGRRGRWQPTPGRSGYPPGATASGRPEI